MNATSLARIIIAVTLLVMSSAGMAARKGAHKAASKAPSAADIAAQWGLVGTWAVDCAKQPAIDNGYQRYLRRGNELILDRDFGDNKDTSKIVSVTLLPDGALELRIEFTGLSQTRAMAVAKGSDGRMRAQSNRDIKGDYTVRDGKFLGSGGATPWQSRCP